MLPGSHEDNQGNGRNDCPENYPLQNAAWQRLRPICSISDGTDFALQAPKEVG